MSMDLVLEPDQEGKSLDSVDSGSEHFFHKEREFDGKRLSLYGRIHQVLWLNIVGSDDSLSLESAALVYVLIKFAEYEDALIAAKVTEEEHRYRMAVRSWHREHIGRAETRAEVSMFLAEYDNKQTRKIIELATAILAEEKGSRLQPEDGTNSGKEEEPGK